MPRGESAKPRAGDCRRPRRGLARRRQVELFDARAAHSRQHHRLREASASSPSTINYRMSERAAYPAALQDLSNGAVRWLRAMPRSTSSIKITSARSEIPRAGHLALLASRFSTSGNGPRRWKALARAVEHRAGCRHDKRPRRHDRAIRTGGLANRRLESSCGGPPEVRAELPHTSGASPQQYVGKQAPPLMLFTAWWTTRSPSKRPTASWRNWSKPALTT